MTKLSHQSVDVLIEVVERALDLRAANEARLAAARASSEMQVALWRTTKDWFDEPYTPEQEALIDASNTAYRAWEQAQLLFDAALSKVTR